MKIQIINHQGDDDIIEARNGIKICDGDSHEFIISLNKFGELEINGLDGRIHVIPQYSNEIILKQ